ncbi:hypothetical protein KAR91_59370 [Candidatus Pacearchaeota archaeon]|nr:hypothetical protein [Candidatus Pacearchaeota archaeon]
MKSKERAHTYAYLHTNGSMITKPGGIGDPHKYFESDFVVDWWALNNRDDVISMISEIKTRGLYLDNAERRIKNIEGMYNITSSDYFRHAVKVAAEEG